MRRVLVPSLALAVVGILLFLVPVASAGHWCAQTGFSFAPQSTAATRAADFTVTVSNTGVDNTQLNSVQMKFSWEGTWRNAGSGTILAGQSRAFTVSATPPSPGSYSVEIKATGTSSGDWLNEVVDCTSTSAITATAAPTPGFEGAFAAIALGGVALAALGTRRN